MKIKEFLYQSDQQLQAQLPQDQGGRACLIQIFTDALLPAEAVALAQRIQTLCPQAQVMGTTVSGVIYQGEQYDDCTLVVVEQFEKAGVDTHLVGLSGKSYGEIASEIHDRVGAQTPALLRLFVGGYYDYAHQLIEEMNRQCPKVNIVGGMAGELHRHPKEPPFVFNNQGFLAEGLVFCALHGEALMVYGRINTAHEALGEVYTITEARDRSIISIEGEPAQQWLQRNFGVLSTKEYETWEEIAQNDPLVRLQLALEDHKRSIRFIRYDEVKNEITQYFSRLPAGTQFRIGYTSPSKCAEESIETCRQVATTPIEQLFCYSCLFRKLYLENCAKWELTPYHENPVSGVFLLGEFGYSHEGNSLLNGSCVVSGIAEQERYLTVDMHSLEELEDIRNEDEKLMNFIRKKHRMTHSHEHRKILEEMVAHESNRIVNPFQRMNVGVSIGDLSKYEQDREYLRFNKLCMVRVENADVLATQRGQLGYFAHLKYVLESLKETKETNGFMDKLHFYSIKTDTFLVAANMSVTGEDFLQYIHKLQQRCERIQKKQMDILFLLRFVVVRNHPFLLERTYAMIDEFRNSQLPVVVDAHFDDGELNPINDEASDELSRIQIIQDALEYDRVVPYYQGLYNNETGKVDKYEALMRIFDAEGKMYAPAQFMDLSKKYRLYLDLNLRMFQTVLRDFSQIDCHVSINLSVHDILSPRFRQEMRKALETFHKPSNLTFELLEDECIANMAGIREFIKEARSYGVNIAVDDFGSGYSNLLEITKIRPDFIKIDGQIISNLERDPENESILEAVSLLSKRLSIKLVAEYVETAAIQERILGYKVCYSQGFYFSRPQPLDRALCQGKVEKGEVCTLTDLPQKPTDVAVQEKKIVEDEGDFFRAVQALTSDLLFRFDLVSGLNRYFGVAQQELGIPAEIERFPHSVIETNLVEKEDVPALLRSVECMRQGVEQPAYFRLYNVKNVANWYRMDYKVVPDQRGVPVEVIGKLTNIQKEKDMEDRINIDTMTGCLRKEAFEALVSEYMGQNPDGEGILIIIDLDNFKSVNDNLGHQFGDRVLRGVGDKLRALFRSEDFVGRIGGDEFMVMMTGTDSVEVAKRKAGEILSALDATYTGAVHAYRVSASIGIATYPKHGENFQALYDHADVALFDAKNRGKNGYVLYHSTLSKGTMENTLPFEVAARTLAQHYDSQVVEEAFNLLFETKEFDISIQAVLELVGKRFGVSRSYVFERHPTIVDSYQNTYEWCNHGVTSEKWRLDDVPTALLQDFFDQANGDGVLYCNDLSLLTLEESREIMEAQGIKSFLHTYTPSKENVSYILGVDTCDTQRVWTPIEVSTILQTGKIIAQFLSYKKTLHDAELMAQEKLSVLDSMHYYAYVIDSHSYELLYFNQYTKEKVSNIALGETCHQVFHGSNAPCENCPLKVLHKQGGDHIQSMMSNSILGESLLTLTTLQPSFAGRECASITAVSLDKVDDICIRAEK